MAQGLQDFGCFGLGGACIDTVQASYMVQDGVIVKLYRNQDGSAREDDLVAVINTETGSSVINRAAKVGNIATPAATSDGK